MGYYSCCFFCFDVTKKSSEMGKKWEKTFFRKLFCSCRFGDGYV